MFKVVKNTPNMQTIIDYLNNSSFEDTDQFFREFRLSNKIKGDYFICLKKMNVNKIKYLNNVNIITIDCSSSPKLSVSGGNSSFSKNKVMFKMGLESLYNYGIVDKYFERLFQYSCGDISLSDLQSIVYIPVKGADMYPLKVVTGLKELTGMNVFRSDSYCCGVLN